MIGLFDTHLHIDDFAAAEEDLAAARHAGVTRFLIAGGDAAGSARAADLAGRHADVYAAAGIHPHEASSFAGTEPFLPLYSRPRVVAVGEIGLDYHYDFSPRDRQREAFAAFLETAGRLGLPAIVHCREAFDDVMSLLREHLRPGFRFEIHSFTGTPAQAEECLSLGAYLSVNGMVTFRKADNIRAALAVIPMDRLLLETDSPYLAPVPHRGHRNQPAYVTCVARAVAEEKGLTVEAVTEATTRNACSFFGLAAD